MDRRHFLQALGASTSLAGLPAWAAIDPATTTDRWQSDFDAARANAPWTAGYAGLQAAVPPLALRLQGRLPADLIGGTFYRNGPARHGLGGIRYHHWFDGDGMVQAYRMGEGGITHQGRFVRTQKFVADSRAGRPV